MISIQQWRAAIGCFGSIKSTKSPSGGFKMPENVSEIKSDKSLFILGISGIACVFLSLSLLPFSNYNLDTGIGNCGQHHGPVVQTLLIMGGVEQNPGPTPTEIFGDLIKNAPSDDIKKTLNKFKTDADYKTNVNNLNSLKVTVENLRETLAYLRNVDKNLDQNLNLYLKSGLAVLIVQRIDQLLPETCSTCGKGFAIGREETPAITCVICSKGCCQICSDNYKDKFNSIGLNNVFWHCSICSHKRNKDALENQDKLLKQSAKSSPERPEPEDKDEETATDNITETSAIVTDDDKSDKQDENEASEDKKDEEKEIPKCKFFWQGL